MRICYILLVAAATILASSEAIATSDHTKPSKVTFQGVKLINADQTNGANQRRLRGRDHETEEEEERGVNANLDDVFKLDDVFNTKTLRNMADKVVRHDKQKALFSRMAADPEVKSAVLKQIAEKSDKGKWIKSQWNWYVAGNIKKFDKAEIAAMRKQNLIELDDLFNTKTLRNIDDKDVRDAKQKALFNSMVADPVLKSAVLKQIAEMGDKGKWIKSQWNWYMAGNIKKFEKAEIAAMRKQSRPSTISE